MRQPWAFRQRTEAEIAEANGRWAAMEAEQAAIKDRYAPELWTAAEAAYERVEHGPDGPPETPHNEIVAIIADAMEAWRSNPTV